MRLFLFYLLLLSAFFSSAQNRTRVVGRVTEANTGVPIPFANVVFLGTSDGAITDFEGKFVAETTEQIDSIEARYIGFVTKSKAVRAGQAQEINFQLSEDVQTLGEVVVYAGENPAWPVLRNIIANKNKNDKRSLEAYQYEAYTKIELDVDNLSDFIQNRRVMRRISGVMDSIQQIAGEDGKPILPIFISEAISNFYFRNDPYMRYEDILKTNVVGIGVTDGTISSQVLGSTLQEYNFYQNWMNVATKEFVSPIADGWKRYYQYDLVDSTSIDGEYCYRIDFFPKREQDLAFQGTMWIAKADYGIKRIDAEILNSANINWIDGIKIQQDLERTDAGAWIPRKSRVVVDVHKVTDLTAGFIAKFYSSAREIEVNKPYDLDFYENPVTMRENVREYDENFWMENRHDSLTLTERNVYQMVDTLRNIPFVKFSTDMAKFALTGYLKAGPLDIGPYTVFYGDNNIEGRRAGFGGRTNYQLSKKFTIGGYYAYGFDDRRAKYQGYGEFIINRDKWTTLRLSHQRELEQIWLLTRDVNQNSLFYTFSRFGNLTQPFLYTKNRVSFFRQISKGLSQQLDFKQQDFVPQFDFSFSPDADNPNETVSDFSITEVSLNTRFARDEIFVLNGNQRVSLGTYRWPAIDFSYTYGIPGVLGSDLEYHRLQMRIYKKQKLGIVGVGYFDLNGGAVLGDVPYPLLFNTIGNETPIYADFAFNLMNFFEFSSDKYIAFKYRHSFEGFILNRIPLMKKLRWRVVGLANIVYGGMSRRNIELVDYPLDNEGNQLIPFRTLQNKPYVEVGYGVENILNFFRVDFIHRLTYLESPNINKFGVKLSVDLIL